MVYPGDERLGREARDGGWDDRWNDGYDEAPRRGPSGATWVTALILAALVGSGVGYATRSNGGGGSAGGGTTASGVTLPSTGASASSPGPAAAVSALSSYDPTAGGSGLAAPGAAGAPAGSYATQHYSSPSFGGLKPGVGLVLDLGAPTRVASIVVPATVDGTVVELHAGDAAPVDGQPLMLPSASSAVTAAGDGPLTLTSTDSGAHRYWVLWVTRLGSDGQGRYWTTLAAPQVTS